MVSYIHAGISKAASTTLQTHILPNLPGYLGKDLSRANHYRHENAKHLVSSLVNLDRFDGNVPRFDGEFILSNEHLCESVCPLTQAQILVEAFGKDVHLIYVIRNQFDAILSHYRFSGSALRFAPEPYRGKIVSLAAYFEYLERNARNLGGHKARDWVADYFRILDFDTFLAITEKVIPRRQIIIIRFEDLIQDFGIMVRAVGLQPGNLTSPPRANASTGLSPRGLAVLRFLQMLPGEAALRSAAKLYLGPIHRSVAYGGSKVGLTDEMRETIAVRFGAGNIRLSQRYGIDLSGYPQA